MSTLVRVNLSSAGERGQVKTARIPIKIVPATDVLPKPPWIRGKFPGTRAVEELQAVLRKHRVNTVCEEAACPNLPECFGRGTATFMVMGAVCTRRCPFCDVAHGRPAPLDADEPANLARVVSSMGLAYVVITSVDRDDLRDGGAGHIAACVAAIRTQVPNIRIEILVPDFRGRMDAALSRLSDAPPDVFNHNMETVPRLYRKARPGSDYRWSLTLIERFKELHPSIPTKSGLMLGLGESNEEVIDVMRDLRAHACDILTLGQYLRPSPHHLAVERYVPPQEFETLRGLGLGLGFSEVAAGPLVRSSYRADILAKRVGIGYPDTAVAEV